MNKSKIFVFVILSVIVGSTLVAVTPNVTTTRAMKAITPKATYITNPSDGETVSGTITITTTTSADIYIDGVRVAKKVRSYSWDTTSYTDGVHAIKVKVRRYSETITVYVTNDSPPPPPPPPAGDKYALIVGISDYKAISDLSYCDEDATDWYNYLVNSMGYASENIIVLGDSRTNNFPKYDGIATEYNVKYYIDWLINLECDEICFITSGHGGGDGNGNSFNCAWDCASGENGEDGYLDDFEFQAAFTGVVASKVFVFMDHCYSGGMIPEFSSACGNKLYMTTTCTEDGYGWDVGTFRNGAWTYYFLEYALINHFGSNLDTAMEDAFDYASASYPYGGGDTPQEQDNYSGDFTL
ncbi:MAG: hypothetical protein EAX90_14710 [Candidatus Heimdallarchaeota archaeon]|nr:hypothetical protein [Candidatus Heimdallarchaeota archaeon]